ncbi:lipopolysaccharide biosynthesis protein [Sphingomonas sp. LaA6.9]|uniref:lipopolysaccharide biosynthesis protein n=1 Tax=Sphingomonas sp. LaA6.9 TaxID=2919914 RepID=UPI001F4F5C06|nr:oligosaccharide flippase family protein [Sphingomonas sp. LaA6.9]MCJ8158176.1 oligosaccharide flippase family protein [Sphingomonas sp. LaA6.9]
MTASTPEPVTSRDFARGLGTTLLARLGGVIDVVSQPVYVWLFGLAGYGIYAVLWAAVNLTENIADLGMTSSLQRVVPQARDEREAVAALRSALLIGVVPCLVIAAVVSFLAPQVAPLFNAAPRDQAMLVEAVRLFAWALPLWAFVEIATSGLRARRVFGAEIRLRVFWEQIMRLILAASFYAAGLGIMALFVAHLISLALICLLSVRLLAGRYDLRLLLHGPLIDPVFFETFRAGLAILPANAVARLFGDAPAILLNALIPGTAGATSAALYTIARKVSSVVQLVRTAFAYVLAPLASAAARGGKAEVQPLYAFATRLAFAIVVPLGFVLAAGGEAILGVFGRGADAAHIALVVLILARMAEAVFGSAVPVQQVIGGYRQQVVASAIGLSAAALVGASLVERYGLTGMALATSTGFIIAAIIPLFQLHRYDDVHPFAQPFARMATLTVLISLPGLVLAIPAAKLQPDIVQLPLVVLIAVASIWAVCRFALPHADRAALGKTGRKLRLT